MWSATPGWSSCYVGLSVLAGLLVPLNAWLLAQVLDAVASGDGEVVGTVLALGAVGVLTAALGPLARYLQAEIGRRLRLRAKSTLMRGVNAIPGLARLEQPAFLDRLRLAEQAAAGAPQVLAQAVFNGGQATFTAVGVAAILAAVSPWLVLLAAASCLPAVVAAVVESRDRARMMWQTSPGLRREMFYSGLMTDPRAAMETRVFGLGTVLHDRMVADMRRIARSQRGVDRRALQWQGGLAVLTAAVTGLAVLWGAQRAAAGELTVGELSMLVTGLAGAQAAASAVVRAFGDGHHSVLVFGHYDAVLATSARDVGPSTGPGPAPATADRQPALEARAGIELRDVSFAYSPAHPPVLHDVSFTIPAGSMVALVGANGAGKSTVVKLLCRLYEPTGGVVTWDGVDIARLSPDEVRGRVAVLFQDFMRYDLTAADNIGFGDVPRIDDRQAIRQAAALAGADGMVAGLSHGYDTMLSRAFGGPDDAEGVQLSGGQWQRLAMARTLMRSGAELVILDEPSSGLDAEAEAALYQHLRTLRGDRACLMVAHRLSAVRTADQIVVLSEGRVAEQGTHDELMDAGGEYARLFRLQAGGYGRLTDATVA